MSLPERILGSPLVQPSGPATSGVLVFGAVVSLLGDSFYFVGLASQVAARTDRRLTADGGTR